ncbi:MAG: putative glycosyltransferase [Firmicutes bacterium]|nr:putative glycosyltransferase [Bacillota bacterium]
MSLGDCKIVMIGPLPPPLGGIAVFLHRLSKVHTEYEFIKENGMSKVEWLYQCCKKKRHLIYHSPNVNRIISLLIIKMLTGNKYSIFSHGSIMMDSYVNGNMLTRYLLQEAARQTEFVYVLNSKIFTFMVQNLGVNQERVKLVSSFLPPILEEEDNILNSYSQQMLDFSQDHSPLLIVNASRLTFYQGVDLYGIDMCVNLMPKIIEIFPRAGLIIALAEIGDLNYYQFLQSEVIKNGLQSVIHVMTGNKEVWPLFKRVHLLVRPTITDGDAISLREAIAFGCPTVASDVCDRPAETVLFKARDEEAFFAVVMEVLSLEEH